MVHAALFRDRTDAGRVLGAAVEGLWTGERVVVLGLPRGGVPVAAGVAVALHAPLDVFVARKLGVPGQPELAMGAIATGGTRVLNEALVRRLQIPQSAIEDVTRTELAELLRREQAYRGDRPPPDLTGTVVLVDDGLATGATMRAALRAVRALSPYRLVVAVPVGAPDTCRALSADADEVICPHQPARLDAIGTFYADFTQTSDEQVRRLLGVTS